MKTWKKLLAAALLGAGIAGTHAQQAAPAPSQEAAGAAAATLAEGEVRKVDKDAGKVTLRHGPIANLDMPAMTMVFKTADPKMLQTLKEGDKIRFSAERVNGAITLTRVEDSR